MTENYHGMLEKYGRAFGDYLAKDPITTRTADDFIIDDCGLVAHAVEKHYYIKEWLKDSQRTIREEDDEYEEESTSITALPTTHSEPSDTGANTTALSTSSSSTDDATIANLTPSLILPSAHSELVSRSYYLSAAFSCIVLSRCR